jgi:uncharacterized protein YjbI with pentapeptide repeats
MGSRSGSSQKESHSRKFLIWSDALPFLSFVSIVAFWQVTPYLWRLPENQINNIQQGLPKEKRLTVKEEAELIDKYRGTLIGGIGTIATITGGIGLFLNLRIEHERLRLERTKVADDARLSESRLTTERFSQALEHLGSESVHIQIRGIYSLEQLSKNSPEDFWTVMEVLVAFIRETSPLETKPAGYYEATVPASTSVKAALTVIRRRSPDRENDDNKMFFDLSNTNLNNADLHNTRMIGANLRGSKLSQAKLSKIDLTDANLSCADFSSTELHDAILEKANLRKIDLIGAQLNKANLVGADLTGAKLIAANLVGADLTDADLTGADLSGANLSGADLSGADLSGADLWQADLRGAKLNKAVLHGAKLRADLRNTQLNGADLSNSDLTQADLRGTSLNGADFRDSVLSQANLNGVNLSQAKNLTEKQRREISSYERLNQVSALESEEIMPF